MSKKIRAYQYAPVTGVPPLDNRYRAAWKSFWLDLTGYQYSRPAPNLWAPGLPRKAKKTAKRATLKARLNQLPYSTSITEIYR